MPWGLFLEGPEKFSHPESHSNILNPMIRALFYSYVLNMNRGSLHTRSFRGIHLSVFRYRLTKIGFSGPKSFRDFQETGPQTQCHKWVKFVVGSRLVPKVFLWVLQFSSLHKNQQVKILIWKLQTKCLSMGCATTNCYVYNLLFIYMYLLFI